MKVPPRDDIAHWTNGLSSAVEITAVLARAHNSVHETIIARRYVLAFTFAFGITSSNALEQLIRNLLLDTETGRTTDGRLRLCERLGVAALLPCDRSAMLQSSYVSEAPCPLLLRANCSNALFLWKTHRAIRMPRVRAAVSRCRLRGLRLLHRGSTTTTCGGALEALVQWQYQGAYKTSQRSRRNGSSANCTRLSTYGWPASASSDTRCLASSCRCKMPAEGFLPAALWLDRRKFM